MTMASQIHTAIDFYERHPISAQTILTKLEAARGTLDGLRPDELFPHDQDHYGGIAANDALAKCAHIGPGTKVVANSGTPPVRSLTPSSTSLENE
jgi:sarcosine/dimethylglycine N-methyltransferase